MERAKKHEVVPEQLFMIILIVLGIVYCSVRSGMEMNERAFGHYRLRPLR